MSHLYFTFIFSILHSALPREQSHAGSKETTTACHMPVKPHSVQSPSSPQPAGEWR